MAGRTAPRQILGQAAAGEGVQFILTNSLIGFLRAELLTYKATVRRSGRSLTD